STVGNSRTTQAFTSQIDSNVGSYGGASPGHCYRANMAASSPDDAQELGSAQICSYGQPPPPPPPISYCNPENANPNGDCVSPIVLNLERGAYRLSGTDDPVAFDLDADGAKDTVSWTARGAA